MGMKQTIDVINVMEADGVIGRYAIAGAVAAYNYIEPTVTEDVDILVSLDVPSSSPRSGLITLVPILSYLKSRGYDEYRKEGLLIGGWPVQFLPVADDLDAEALTQAQEVEITVNVSDGNVKTRVLRPEHLVAISLRVGRPKDAIRIIQFLDAGAINPGLLRDILTRHKLIDAWLAFCRRAGTADPCDLQSGR
jgi:hypothetical protein